MIKTMNNKNKKPGAKLNSDTRSLHSIPALGGGVGEGGARSSKLYGRLGG